MKAKLLPQMLLLSVFLHYRVRQNQNMFKEPSFGTPRGLSTFLLTLILRTTPIDVFRDYFSFSHFWGDFLLPLEQKTNFIKICTKFGVKQAIILLSECTSLLLRSKPQQRSCLHFFKIFKKQPAL